MQGVRFAATSHVPLGLRVLAPTGEAWAVAEPGQTTTATVDLVAPYSGSYRVLMVVPPGTDTASIAFSMTPLDPPAAVALSTPSTPMVVELGQTVTGRYDVPPAPGAAQPWTLVLRERALVGAFLRGTGYDPRMHLLDAAGNVLEASDDALEADAYVQLVLEPGLYTVAAEQAGSGVGTYTLDVFGGPRTRLEVPTLTPTSPLQLALIEGLPRNHTGRRVAPFAVEVPAGSDVVVRLSGFLVDPLVFVYDPAGNWVAMNDDAPDGTLNSEILLSGSRPGVYVLHAATYNNALGTLTATAVLTPSVTAP